MIVTHFISAYCSVIFDYQFSNTTADTIFALSVGCLVALEVTAT